MKVTKKFLRAVQRTAKQAVVDGGEYNHLAVIKHGVCEVVGNKIVGTVEGREASVGGIVCESVLARYEIPATGGKLTVKFYVGKEYNATSFYNVMPLRLGGVNQP